MEPVGGRTAVVVGASSGVGRAVARRLAAEGATVVAGARRADRLDELAKDCEGAAGRVVPVAVDVRDPDSVAALLDCAAGQQPPFDLLVNTAGVVYYGDFAEQAFAEWDEMVGVNLVGAMHVLQAAIARLLPRGGGRVVQVTSVTATLAIPGVSVYGATKAGVSRLLAGLRGEYAERGIRISELELGATRDTEAGSGTIRSSPEVLDRLLRWSGGGRTMPLDDVVDAVLFLLQASGRARVDHLRLREASDIPT